MPVDLYREFEHYGLDTLSSPTLRKPGYFEDALNVIPTLSGSIRKRPGFKPVADSVGGQGLFKYVTFEDRDVELLTLFQGSLYRRLESQLVITFNSNSFTCHVSLVYDDDQAEYILFLYLNGEELLNIDLGLGIDNEHGTPLSDVADEIDAVPLVTAEVIGDDTVAAAFLFPLQVQTEVLQGGGTLTLTAFSWERVNETVTAPLHDHWETRDDADYQRASACDVVGNKYIACDPSPGLMKYDGQTFYRAGVPQLNTPSVVEVAATGNEETTVVTCIADATGAEISSIRFDDTEGDDNEWGPLNNGHYFTIYDDVGSVGVYGRSGGSTDLPPSGVDRVIKFNYTAGSNNTAVATTARTEIDADSKFSCTRVGTTLTITSSSIGEREDINTTFSETFDSLSVIQQGGSGLGGTFFKIFDISGSVAVWYQTGAMEAEPSHGCDRAIKVTITAGNTAAQVATATVTAVDADAAFAASAASEVVTIVDAVDGVRTNATPETSGFGIAVTVQGTSAGLGDATYTYHLTAEQDDAINLITEGMPTDDVSVNHSSGTKNSQLTIFPIQPDSGFNTGCAIVSGNQANVNTITVNTGHTLEIGDKAFFQAQPQNAVPEITTITTVADSGGSLDGDYFYLFGRTGGVESLTAFWIDVDNNGTTEPSHGAPNSVEITTITTGMTAAQVANEVAAAIDARPEWSASDASNVVTVTDAVSEERSDGSDGTTGFTFAVTQQGSAARAGEGITRLITATTSSSITVDGDPVTLVDDQAISNGLKINIWRTEGDGVAISKFLVDTIPNNSLVESHSYIDQIADTSLGRIWEEPKLDHGLPPSGRYVSAWNSVIVIGGNPDYPSLAYYSIAGETSPEYFPPESNQVSLDSIFGDVIKGVYPAAEFFQAFKDNCYFTFSGDIYQDNVRVDQMMKADMEFSSHHAIVDRRENILFLDREGVFELGPGGYPEEKSKIIQPSFDLDSTAIFLRAHAFLRRDLNQLYFFIPLEAESDTDSRYATMDSKVFVYNFDNNSWYIWDALNMAGGMVQIGNDIFFQEETYSSVTESVRYHLHRLGDENIGQSFADLNEPISAYFRTARYGADTPEIYKKFVRIRVQSDPNYITADESITVETHKGLTSTAPHSSFTLLPDTVGRSKQRLLPTKDTALAVTFSNEELHQNMALVGWSMEGGVLGNQRNMKE